MSLPYEVVMPCPAHDDAEGREKWLRMRRTGLGASDMPSVMGCGYRTPLELYARLVGAIPDDEADVDFLRMGRRLEPAIREEFAYQSGVEVVEWQETLRSTVHRWAFATPDGCACLDHEDGGPHIPVELKSMGGMAFSRWDADGVPLRWRIQNLHQQLVVGAPYGYVAVLVANPVHRVLWARIERDEALIAEIVRAGEEFWRRVEAQDPPYPTGEEGDSDALRALYPKAMVTEPVSMPGDALDWDAELQELKQSIKAAETRKRELENRIKASIGDAEVGVLSDGTVYRLSRQEIAEATRTVKAHTRHVLYRKEAK